MENIIAVITFWLLIMLIHKLTRRNPFVMMAYASLVPVIAYRMSSRVISRSWRNTLAYNIFDKRLARRLDRGHLILLGQTPIKPMLIDLAQHHHLLITGITGEGKTTIAFNIILSLLSRGPGIFSRFEFVVHDPKRVIGLHLKVLADLYPDQIRINLDPGPDSLDILLDEMFARTEALGHSGQFEFESLGLPRKLIVIEDVQILLGNRGYERSLMKLATAGRQAGFHLVLLTPYGKGDIIPTAYRPNFRFVSGYLPKHGERVVDMPVSRLPRHRFLIRLDQRQPPFIFSPFEIKADHIGHIIDRFTANLSDPELFMLHSFLTIPNCGIRTLLDRGYRHFGNQAKTPFPFNEVKLTGNKLKWSAEAYQAVSQFLEKLTALGLATKSTRGKSRRPIFSYPETFEKWRKQ